MPQCKEKNSRLGAGVTEQLQIQFQLFVRVLYNSKPAGIAHEYYKTQFFIDWRLSHDFVFLLSVIFSRLFPVGFSSVVS
jgi:hypothetical protein